MEMNFVFPCIFYFFLHTSQGTLLQDYVCLPGMELKNRQRYLNQFTALRS
jgi:hypothetical protein